MSVRESVPQQRMLGFWSTGQRRFARRRTGFRDPQMQTFTQPV